MFRRRREEMEREKAKTAEARMALANATARRNRVLGVAQVASELIEHNHFGDATLEAMEQRISWGRGQGKE